MAAHGSNPDRSAVAVISGIVDVLYVDREEKPLPRMPGVIALDDVLATIVQAAVTEDKTEAAISQVILVILLDGVTDEGGTDFIGRPVPACARIVAGNHYGLRVFGVGIGLFLVIVPAEARADAEILGDLLGVVPAEAILHGAEALNRDDVGPLGEAGEVILHRQSVVAHVCGVGE